MTPLVTPSASFRHGPLDPAACTVNATSGLVTFVDIGTCRIEARGAAGTSTDPVTNGPKNYEEVLDSFTITVIARIATAPSTPQSIVVTPGNSQLTVTFTAPATNGGAALMNYLVEAVPTNGGVAGSKLCTTSPCVVTGLTPNPGEYSVQITVANIWEYAATYQVPGTFRPIRAPKPTAPLSPKA
ncbi:MAG: hypothetical protein WCT12_17665, partial [Verrucomicrobiota bacterium]